MLFIQNQVGQSESDALEDLCGVPFVLYLYVIYTCLSGLSVPFARQSKDKCLSMSLHTVLS